MDAPKKAFDFLKRTAPGYKTYAVGAFFILYALAGMVGIDPPQPGDEDQQLGVVGALIILLRAVTVSTK